MSDRNPVTNLPLFAGADAASLGIERRKPLGGAGLDPALEGRARQTGNFDPSTPPINSPRNDLIVRASIQSLPPSTPIQHGMDGAFDANAHLADSAPAFVLHALGDALLALRGTAFTSEQVRAVAERSEAVRDWLAVKGREACYGGWWVSRVELHHLERTGEMRRAQRPQARGRMLPVWVFPA